MKKLATLVPIAALLMVCIASSIWSGPVLNPEPVIDKEIKKIDDKTLELTTTTTMVERIFHNKAELQTELDHIPERRAMLQEQMDAVEEREAELISMLEVFK